VICRDGEALTRAMTTSAAYLAATEERVPMNLGIQMSQAARAIPVWAILATLGRQGLSDLVERTCQLAERIAKRLADNGVEILTPVVLNQVLAAFGDDATTDAVIDAVQRDGTCWMGGTVWHDRHAMRISVSDSSTTEDDIDISADAVVRAWRSTVT
jgi:glutamate/tyrosine decarboxylase-like PLP-dependent enzyme